MPSKSKRANVLLWTAQVLLAALFLFAGGFKLLAPLASLGGPIPLPGTFLRFIGTTEVLGAFGLVLPGLFGIHRWLTPLAAAGLVIIMAGATVLSALAMGPAAAVFPLVVGVVSLSVFRGRGGLAAITRPTLSRATLGHLIGA